MHQFLIDYYNKFQKNNIGVSFDKFYTQYNKGEYFEKLPYLYDIEVFCLRLLKAFLNNERVCIYADYDTDAVTATAVMYWGLVDLGFAKENLSFYTPDRFTEGYGMNAEAVENLCQVNDLIISVDCGINSVLEAEIVKKSNCDLIITDHHHLSGALPEALGVVNCRLAEVYSEDEKLKNKVRESVESVTNGLLEVFDKSVRKEVIKWLELSFSNKDIFASSSVTGVGVAWFSILWLGYFFDYIGIKKFKPSSFNRLLPLVAIGTIADCQSVLDQQNRVLVKSGLQILKTGKHGIFGLNELTKQTGILEKMGQGYELTSQDLAFVYSPILNSSGRVSHANLSISCLLADSPSEATEKAKELIITNNQRKQLVKDMLCEVEELAKEQFDQGIGAIWLEGAWSKGVIGLLASRLVNQYGVPSVVVSNEGEGVVGGSMRAPEGYHLPEAMGKVSDLFEKFGGHPGAAGFTAPSKNIEKIKNSLLNNFLEQKSVVESFIFDSGVELVGSLGLDSLPKQVKDFANKKEIIWLGQDDLNQDLLKSVWKLDPFGQDFPFPNFVLSLTDFNLKWIGTAQNHLKVFANNLSLTGFNLENQKVEITRAKNLWVQAKTSQNTWNGRTNNELIIEKIWTIPQ